MGRRDLGQKDILFTYFYIQGSKPSDGGDLISLNQGLCPWALTIFFR